MDELPHAALSAEEVLGLHRRLLDRDAVAPSEFAAAFLQPLIAWLQFTHSDVDPMACAEAASEAILGFLSNPTRYDSQRLGMEAFLRMAAKYDLLNVLRKEKRHQRNRRDWNDVEQASADGKYLEREDDPSLRLQLEEARQRQALPVAGQRPLTEAERCVWEQMQQGERRHAVFAVLLGVTHLPQAEQRRAVKRVKDRLKKRMERAGGKHEQSS